ncbi:MAG: type II secretion system F family protein [Candidatus Omnitrophica bacterium]|nr:type II secretion system F family protein [Candidatus Omnitrophota bacterium]
MPNFKYKARDSFSRLVNGVIAAENKDHGVKKLQDMGYVIISLSEVSEINPLTLLKRFERVGLEELNIFTRQLYSLQKAGLPLLSSLEAVALQTKSRYFKTVIMDIARNIRGGSSFSSSLKEYNNIFDEVYVSMIKAAEIGGNIVSILERLNSLIEQQIDTRARIKAATRYPMIAFFVLCVGFLIVVTFVIPRFAMIYGQFNATLPLPTRILIFISVLIQKFWFLFILGLIGAIIAFRAFISSKLGRPIWDNFKLKVPILGPLVNLLIMSRFARVTSILMKSGVPILEVLDLTSRTSGNIIISRAILNIRESVSQGRGLSEPMKVSNLFPPVVVQMIAVGEQTGRVDELLFSVADYYDRDAAYMIKNLSTYIEPILILVLGCMVLLMALAIFLPMWNLIRVFRSS